MRDAISFYLFLAVFGALLFVLGHWTACRSMRREKALADARARVSLSLAIRNQDLASREADELGRCWQLLHQPR